MKFYFSSKEYESESIDEMNSETVNELPTYNLLIDFQFPVIDPLTSSATFIAALFDEYNKSEWTELLPPAAPLKEQLVIVIGA